MADFFDEWKKEADAELSQGREAAGSVEFAPDAMEPHRQAIKDIESSGGHYSLIGPTHPKYGRALGAYQIMEANLPEWSREALGRVVTPKEFLGSPEIQDKIFDHKFGQYLAKYGPSGAASTWFSGRPYVTASRDVLGTSVPEYVKMYNEGLKKAGGVEPQAVAAAPALDELEQNFEKFLDKQFPKKAAVAPVQAVPEGGPIPEWGIPQGLASGVLAGHGPAVGAALGAGREALKDVSRGVPLSDAWDLAKKVYYPQLKSQLQQGEETFERERPFPALMSRIAGESVPMLAGVGLAGKGIQAAGRFAPQAASFLLGTAGEGAPGLGGVGTRAASSLASGAWQGGLGNAIIGESPTTGAEWGAGINLVTNPLLRAVTAPLRTTMRPEVARAAQDYVARGGELPVAPLVQGKGVAKTIESLTGRGEPEMVEGFNKLLGDTIGAEPHMAAHGVKGLTPAVLADVKKEISDGFDDWAATHTMDITPDFLTDVHTIVQDAGQKIKSASPQVFKEFSKEIEPLLELLDERIITGNPMLTGDEFKQLISTGGLVDKLYKASGNLTPFAERLHDAFFDALQATSPEAKEYLTQLRSQWKNLRRLEKIAPGDTKGLIQPKRAAKANGKLNDDFGAIARMGEFVPNLDPAGNIAGREAPGIVDRAAKLLPNILSSGIGPGLGMWATGQGPAAFMDLTSAAALAGLGGAGYLAKEGLAGYLRGPAFMQRVIENSLQARPQMAINPLIPPVVQLFRGGQQ